MTLAALPGSGDASDASPGAVPSLVEGVKPSALKIILIGLDGATFDIIEPMVAAGELPEFGRLMAAGAYARLRSEEPMVSPAIWTTIATGRFRQNHNISGFLSSRGNPENPILVATSDRHGAALWNIVSLFPKTVGVVGWWATWPAVRVR